MLQIKLGCIDIYNYSLTVTVNRFIIVIGGAAKIYANVYHDPVTRS